ncbi:MAG TPA: TIGR03943 family protein [Actinomycetota bacterium]|nr:TIGR03943 family protein [Actinomycetota bacterium]
MTRSWSPLRVAVGGALAAWAALFWFLLLSGRTSLYLSSRTAWVVPVGAILLTVSAAGRLASARTGIPEPLGRRTVWGLGFVVLPVAVLLALPPATLGSFAASRRTLSTGLVTTAPNLETGGPVTLASVAAAGWSQDARRSLIRRAGTSVTFDGIVARRDGQPADEFMLTRFIVSCCVADALGVQVRVVGAPPDRFRTDEWVRVSGTFYPVGREVVVDAAAIEPIPRPDNPYLNV